VGGLGLVTGLGLRERIRRCIHKRIGWYEENVMMMMMMMFS
jgi:hypothetical protein